MVFLDHSVDVAQNAGTMTGKSVMLEQDQATVIPIGGALPTTEDAIAVAVAEAKPTYKAILMLQL